MEYDATNPLPESDLTNGTDLESDTVAALAVRGKWSHNSDFTVATRTNPDGTTADFDLTKFDPTNAAYLRYFGFTVFTSRMDSPQAAYDRLVDGKPIGTKEPKTPKVDDWRRAIAAALVDATKKAPNGPMAIEVATAKAMAMDKAKFAAMKQDVAVVKHYNKIAGASIGYSVAAALAEEAEAAA